MRYASIQLMKISNIHCAINSIAVVASIVTARVGEFISKRKEEGV